MDLYAGKAGLVTRLDPLVRRLDHAGISPDSVTLAAVPVALIASGLLLLSPQVPAVLLGVPLLAGLRLLLNLLDGALARHSGRSHPRGELLNELGDRLADVAFLAPVAVLPGASPIVVLLGVVLAVLASFVSVVTGAAGGSRTYRGILSKPGRMVLLSLAALGALGAGPIAWTIFGPLLLVGAALTLLERAAIAVRELP